MTGDEPFTAEELRDLRRLLEIEKIRKKKMLYAHLLDSAHLEAFTELYTEDPTGDWGPFGTWRGRDALLERVKAIFGVKPPYNYLHMTSNLWIELTGPATATSRGYLHDVCTEPLPNVSPTAWFGLYEEDWVKVDGEWKIQHTRVNFLWPSRDPCEGFPRPPPVTR